MNALVGYTGFVGSNLYQNGHFDAVFNSKNITEAYGLKPDLLVYAGMRAEKYLANTFPEKDLELVLEAQKNIEKIQPKRLVLISTIDVIKCPVGVDETVPVTTEGLHPYGYNRYQLELWAKQYDPKALIIRLPGLFGVNIKKNFIYDCIHLIPFMLAEKKMEELSLKEPIIRQYYTLQPNVFYRLNELSVPQEYFLKEVFSKIGFTALNFTDSRSKFQFYPLNRLWDHIQIALENHLKLWHPATEPVSAGELYSFLRGKSFQNEISTSPANYDFKTVYDGLFHGKNGYIYDKKEILTAIRGFVDNYENG